MSIGVAASNPFSIWIFGCSIAAHNNGDPVLARPTAEVDAVQVFWYRVEVDSRPYYRRTVQHWLAIHVV